MLQQQHYHGNAIGPPSILVSGCHTTGYILKFRFPPTQFAPGSNSCTWSVSTSSRLSPDAFITNLLAYTSHTYLPLHNWPVLCMKMVSTVTAPPLGFSRKSLVTSHHASRNDHGYQYNWYIYLFHLLLFWLI